MSELGVVKLLAVGLQAALQCCCIVLAYKAWSNVYSNGDRTFWLWFAGGFSFQLVRRILYVLVLLQLSTPDLRLLTFIIIPSAVSICYTVAMWKVFLYIKDRAILINRSRRELEVLRRELERRVSNGVRV